MRKSLTIGYNQVTMCFKLYIFLVCLHIGSLKADENVEESRSNGPYVIEATKLSQSEHQLIVKLHNLKRSQVTPPATNMLKLVYNQGLADLAVNYSRNCVYAHSDSAARKSLNYDYAGECLSVSTKVIANLTNAVANTMQIWFDERQDYTYETNSCKKGKVCGHYTQMVWASNAAVGCGVTTCGNVLFQGETQPRPIAQLIVCNYGPGGNVRDIHGLQHPYMTGTTCSACPAGKECICKPVIPESSTTPVPDLKSYREEHEVLVLRDENETAMHDQNEATTTTTATVTTATENAISYRSNNFVWILPLLQAIFLFAN